MQRVRGENTWDEFGQNTKDEIVQNTQDELLENTQFMHFLTWVLFWQGEEKGGGDHTYRDVQSAVSALAACCCPQSQSATERLDVSSLAVSLFAHLLQGFQGNKKHSTRVYAFVFEMHVYTAQKWLNCMSLQIWMQANYWSEEGHKQKKHSVKMICESISVKNTCEQLYQW